MTAKQLNRKAIQLNEKLKKLQKEAEDLAEEMRAFSEQEEYKNSRNIVIYPEDEYDFYFADLVYTLEDLASFDLEDHIEDCRY